MKLLIVLLLTFSTAQAACRDSSVVRKFNLEHGYKRGRVGFVVDHQCPLACGGVDTTRNMQYQTIADGKAKDKWETKPWGCKKLCNSTNSTPDRRVFNCK